MSSLTKKPKLVFFQFRFEPHLPKFLQMHAHDHVNCLSQFFDVVRINEDSDYGEVCDTHEPDLVLFETGVNHLTCHRLKISNVRSHSHVPKLALHNADAFCDARAGFLSDMDHWGIETAFAISTTAAEHNPEIAHKLFVWPVFIDPAIHRDYGERKSVPLLFSGNTNGLYPWRKQILKLVPPRYPSLICPHPGYSAGRPAAKVFVGEDYARLINASLLAPSCGTVVKDVVRKHFEIPACKSCLITERSAAAEAAGFVDMHNCVFADDRDILDKIDHLFANRDTLEQITQRGHEMVHARHTSLQRDQIFQWFNLQKGVLSHQRIVQDGPFGQLRVVDQSSGVQSVHVRGEGVHLRLLEQGDELFWAGRPAEAESFYLKCQNYMGWMPLAICG